MSRAAWALVGGGVAAALVVGGWLVVRRPAPGVPGAPSASGAPRARPLGSALPIVRVAPAPVPASTPLLGPEGRDAEGAPTQYVDRAALRSALAARRFADLDRWFGELEAAFEADPARELWPADAADAFGSADPEIGPLLDAWVAASPESFAAHLARAAHRTAAAQTRAAQRWGRGKGGRGRDGGAPDTGRPPGLDDAVSRALADADRSLALRPKQVAARREKIRALTLRSEPTPIKQVLDDALAVCPSCLQIRITYLHALSPRWGGSYEAMDGFARAALDPARPRTRLLAGYADHDRARVLRGEKKLDQAREAIEKACALGDHWEFLVERARIDGHRGDWAHALADLERAAALRPGHPEILARRAAAHVERAEWEAAGRDLLFVLRVTPTESLARSVHRRVVDGLLAAVTEHERGGRPDDALRVLDLALALAPGDPGAAQAKARLGGGKP